MANTIPHILLAIGLTVAASGVSAQVNKCKDADGRVTYSDRPCVDGGTGERVNTQGNALDGSTDRLNAARNRVQAESDAESREVNSMMQSAPAQCTFKSFRFGDKKGTVLADNAKRECLKNLIAERKGEPSSDRDYRLWREHFDSERAARAQRSSNSRTYDCMPNGYGGATCR